MSARKRKIRRTEPKDRTGVILLVLALALGSLARLWNLDGARFLWPDEFRSIQPLSPMNLCRVPFLNVVYKAGMFVIGRSQENAILLTTLLGIASVPLVYLVGKKLFGGRAAGFAALFMAVSGIHVEYSRTAYPASLQCLLLLAAFYFLLCHLERPARYHALPVLTGFLLGLSFLTYAPSYAVIGAFVVLYAVVLRMRKADWPRVAGSAMVLVMAIISALVLCQILAQFGGMSYFENVLEYQKTTEVYAAANIGRFSLAAPWVSLKEFWTAGGWSQSLLALASAVFAVAQALRRRDERWVLLAGLIIGGYLILAVFCFFGMHVIFPRRIVFLAPFLALAGGGLMEWMGARWRRVLPVALTGGMIAVSAPDLYAVTQWTFRIKPITRWLKENGIEKGQITSYVDLIEKADTSRQFGVPGGYPEEHWQGQFQIDWRGVSMLRQTQGVRYILTSGLGSLSQIGENDQLLQDITPIKSWPHPINLRSESGDKKQDFKLYDLQEVFDAFIRKASAGTDANQSPVS